MTRTALPPALDAARQQWHALWRTLGVRERRLLVVAAALIGIALLWAIAVRPAWRTLRDAPVRVEALDAQLQQMQRLAAETRELRALPKVGAVQSDEALRAATQRLGPNAKLALLGDRATLTLNGVPGDAFTAWLGEARSAARARPIEAQLSRGPNGYSGSVVLSLVRGG
jgi:general secretion pathway protein M